MARRVIVEFFHVATHKVVQVHEVPINRCLCPITREDVYQREGSFRHCFVPTHKSFVGFTAFLV